MTVNPAMTELPRPAGVPVQLSDDETFFTRREAAAYLRCSIERLEKLAQKGEAPRFKRVGRKALYPLAELRRVAGVAA